ncbi:MAG TPA: hypothetical protein PKW90_10690, partial [Myxococcota bacterium]|nr:hypothetical protein [Myxococcota bacterium]
MAAGAVGPARARLVETRRALSQLVEEIGPENPALAARAAVALWPVQLRRDPVRFVGLAEPLLRQELPPELRGRLLVCMAECQRVIGNMTGADRTLDEAERLLPTEAHAARAHLLITRCQLCFWKGTPVSEARAWLEAARAQLSLQADRRLELRMWLAHAQCQDREGNPLAARGYSAQAAEGARAIGDDELLAISLQFLAYCDRRDDPENTIRLCREAEALFLRSGDSLGALVSASATGSALWQLGQLEEARRVAERTGIRARALGDTLRAAQAQDLEAYIAFELELFDLARQRWAEAARLAAELGIRALEGSAALGLGVVAQAEGRLAEARAAFEAVATQRLQQDDRLWVLLVHALLQAEVGDRSSFWALVDPLELQLAGTTEAVRSTYRAVLAFAQALLDRKAVAAAATVCAAQLREVGSGAGNLPRATRILVDRVAARCG